MNRKALHSRSREGFQHAYLHSANTIVVKAKRHNNRVKVCLLIDIR